MDSKEIKSALKEAREAIKNKEFASSLKICKSILKSDRENYMALVFFGLSLQDVGPKDQAVHAFRKAIVVSPDQALAWHGLANYYEKEDSIDARKELLAVYEKLLKLESDLTKFSDFCCKYVNIAVYLQDVVHSSETLKKFAMDEKNSEQKQRTAWLALASLFTQIKDLPSDILPLFEQTLQVILSSKEATSVTSDYYKEYLKILYKLKKFSNLFKEAISMQQLFENNIYPLEWICKVYVESYIEENSVFSEFENDIENYYTKLLELQNDAVMGIFTKGVIAFKNKDFMTARNTLKDVVAIRVGLVHAWVLLADCQYKLHCYHEAVLAAGRADKILQVVSKEYLQKKLEKIYIASLARHNDKEKWMQALEISKKVDHMDHNLLKSVIIAHINLKNYEEAEKLISNLTEENPIVLKAKILHSQNKLTQALNLLTSINIETYEYFNDLGILYWTLKQYQNSYVPFLKAAKLDPNSYEIFVYLGKYYEHFKDVDKARRCYLKAYQINPTNSEAGVGLSNIYRQQKNWDANFALLYSVTGKDKIDGLPVINADVHWAWLQLGLHYLEQGDYYNSIDSLRSVIRVESNNSHYWECLADAYMARGSYTSAMKSYERATELTDQNLYAKLQVASIKLLIGLLPEAKEEFKQILLDNKTYVPALKGMAETCLNLAFKYKKEQLLGLCKTNAQEALDNLTTALKERTDLSCLWKLTADSCFLVGCLPEKYSEMVVHSALSEKNTNDYEIFTKEQLLTLAARCYCKAVTILPKNINLWHDLAHCYYTHGSFIEDTAPSFDLLDKALQVTKYCVKNDPKNWMHWNLLGVIAVNIRMKDYALGQHAFIKSVTLEPNCAISWCNLGALYYMLGDIKLANKSYSQAQRSDPSYVNSWIGQALIADELDYEDAMDLFRHSTQLGYHNQGALNYASWVCKTITDNPKNVELYSIKNMHAIPVAWDEMIWYTENNPNHACGWNMLGVLSERMGLKNTALKAFKKSLSLMTDDERDKILVNYGRLLTETGKFEKAVETFKYIREASFNGGSGLALALFKAKQYEESYDSYDTTMQWLAENENLQSHVLVALAAMAYMFQGPDSAKTLLFQSTQLNPPSYWGLYATLSLGLLHKDINLAQLVLKELHQIRDEPDVIYHNAILDTYTYLVQGDKKKCIRCLTKYLHRHPNEASLWLSYSVLLLQMDFRSFSQIAAKCAQVAMNLGRTQMDVTKVWCIVAYASLLSKDITQALKTAQKAVHCYPHIIEGWQLLFSALNFCKTVEEKWKGKQKWLTSILTYIKTFSCNNDSSWLTKEFIR